VKQQQGLAARLASIEGHVKAIKRMVDDDAYCIDVLKQTYAVERALKRFEAELLRVIWRVACPRGFATAEGTRSSRSSATCSSSLSASRE